MYECKGSVYLYPRLSTCAFETYVFYDADKAPDLYNAYPTWAGGSYQLAALTTAQCKSRLSFEGPDAIIPFKLKQTT